MSRLLKRRLALLTALLAVLAGGTAVALGASASGGRARATRAHSGKHPAVLATAAGYLGVPATQLKQELRSGKSLAQVAEATAGKTSSGLIAALLVSRTAQVRQQVTALVEHVGGAKAAHRQSPRHTARAAALAYLGLSREQLGKQLRAGHSLAEVADATPGKSSARLSEAIAGALGQRLQSAVVSKHLSRAQQRARGIRLSERVTVLLGHRHSPPKHSAH